MKIYNIKEINKSNIKKILTNRQIIRMIGHNIIYQDIIDNMLVIYKMKENDTIFEINEELLEMIIDCIIGYKEWLSELDTYDYCDYYNIYCEKEKMTCEGCYYRKGGKIK